MDTVMDLASYKESLIGGLNDLEEVEKEILEMQNAKVGTIKPNCWEKVSEDSFLVYGL